MKTNRTKLLTCCHPLCEEQLEVSVYAALVYCSKHKAESVATRARIYHTADDEEIIDPVDGEHDPLKGFDHLFASVKPVDFNDFPGILKLAGMRR